MKKVVVFDFDGTLTNYDTLVRFFMEQIKMQKRYGLFVVLFALKVSSKLKMTSIAFEKITMLKLLFGCNMAKMRTAFIDYARCIQLNELGNLPNRKQLEGSRVIILSASPAEYIKQVYPSCEVVGLEFSLTNESLSVMYHPYGEEKKRILINMGLDRIDEFYYDSKSDEAVLPIVIKGYKVKQGKIIVL